MASKMDFAIYCFSLIILGLVDAQIEQFNEELYVKPLHNGYLYTHLQFTTIDKTNLESRRHYSLFPKSLGEVLSKYRVQEMHLSLTQSRWRHESWGYPMEDAAPGAELWVWFKERTTNIDAQWTELINVLSGLFCASLNFMDKTNTIVPRVTFRPRGTSSYTYDRFATKNVRYASLPRENVCTENLTPWKKLLPCGSRAGLASLLKALKIHQGSYHSIALDFRPICMDEACEETGVELKQTLSVVFDTKILNPLGGQDWNLRKMFDRQLKDSCPLATVSNIYVDISSNKTSDYNFKLSPVPTRIEEFKRATSKSTYAVYDINQYAKDGRVLHLEAKYITPMSHYTEPTPPILHTQRFQTGYGQEKGGIMTLIYNNHPKKPITIAYLETVPWFLRVYYHTLVIESFDAEDMGNIAGNGTVIKPAQTHYLPGRDRERPYYLELVITLPPQSITRLSFQFERALLKWTEYPPDANHGFYVSSAVISTVVPTSKQYTAVQQNGSLIQDIFDDQSTSFFLRLHTESLLVILPTPDFSMPYNVICLACTVLAIAFGSIHNLTTRTFTVFDPAKHKGLLTKLKEKFGKKKETADVKSAAESEGENHGLDNQNEEDEGNKHVTNDESIAKKQSKED